MIKMLMNLIAKNFADTVLSEIIKEFPDLKNCP